MSMSTSDSSKRKITSRLRRVAAEMPLLSRYEAQIAKLDRRRAELARQLAELQVDYEKLQAEAGDQSANDSHAEFVPAGHFYSAVPHLSDLRKRYQQLAERDPTRVGGVDLATERQWIVLDELEQYLPAMPFGDVPEGELRFGFENSAFGSGDGTMLHLVLRWLRPKNIIEVGSGHSSACTLDTVDLFLGRENCSLTFVEPHDQLLRSLLRQGDDERVRILAKPVQDVPAGVFAALQEGDLLFIDSTHVVKAGSDVNYLFFEVLPVLKPGVVVHIHDIFPGFEYPWSWIEEGRVWQEDYLLRAFLQYNREFEVLLWPGLLAATQPERIFDRYPTLRRNPGGSIYLRRRV